MKNSWKILSRIPVTLVLAERYNKQVADSFQKKEKQMTLPVLYVELDILKGIQDKNSVA